MVNKEVTVLNKLGLHARPCSLLVKVASKFRSDLKIKKGNMEVNGKSIMGVMMLAAECGSVLQIVLEGVDEEDAFFEIEKLFLKRFEEE